MADTDVPLTTTVGALQLLLDHAAIPMGAKPYDWAYANNRLIEAALNALPALLQEHARANELAAEAERLLSGNNASALYGEDQHKRGNAILSDLRAMTKRAEAAEARVLALTAALQAIAGCQSHHAGDVVAIARAALSGEPK